VHPRRWGDAALLEEVVEPVTEELMAGYGLKPALARAMVSAIALPNG